MGKKTDKKLKMTLQRTAILEYLEGSASHPSVEEIYEAVQKRYPMITISTIYNTLRTLMDMGKVWVVTIDKEKKRYDPIPKPHNHLICLGCKKIVDIPIEFALNIPDEFSQGYLLKGSHVEFYGLCQKCR